MFDRFMAFHSFRTGLGFSSIKCWLLQDMSTLARQTFPVSYQWPPPAALGAAGQDLGEDKKEPREGEKKEVERLTD